ncbi:hypothetical protein cypCar_00003216, partial [Cyprinus carpio]
LQKGGEECVGTEPARVRRLNLTDPHQKLAALSSLARRGCRGRARQGLLGEFIALDDGHTELESPEAHISAVGAVRPPKRRFCVGATHQRVILVYDANRNTAGEEKACLLQRVDHITKYQGEWLDARCRGVRSANAYILVYDICCVESFEYVKMIRQQIMDNRVGSSREVPILVVGSKRDLQRHRFTQRRAVSVLVKKTWKCGYVECSAKYNWHVLLLFKELLGIAVARGLRTNHTSIRLQGALQRNRCNVM